MEFEDRMVLTTPEGVTLELPLAGLGSRLAASLLDWSLRLAVLVAIGAVAGIAQNGWITGIAVALFFVNVFLTDILFETFASGRTPGKRWTGLRVVDREGAPVRFVPSAVRNLLRLVDILPGVYLVGVVTVLVTRNNQRLGDLAAGTLVVRERQAAPVAAWQPPPVGDAALAGWDLATVTADEVGTVRRFLERRAGLLPDARHRLAAELAARLRAKVATPEPVADDERFLELLVAASAR